MEKGGETKEGRGGCKSDLFVYAIWYGLLQAPVGNA